MTQYVLNMIQPDGQRPDQDVLDDVMVRLGELNYELKKAGAWVFSAGLHPASSATVVSTKIGVPGAEILTTDGPFVEAKEHVGGFWLIEAPDLDAALGWAERIVGITTLPIEIRPVARPGGRRPGSGLR